MKGLIEGAKHLDYMINDKKLTVYVHCNSGVTRAPSVAIAYLCLFLKHPQWQDPKEVEKFVRSHHTVSTPNMLVTEKCIKQNAHI